MRWCFPKDPRFQANVAEYHNPSFKEIDKPKDWIFANIWKLCRTFIFLNSAESILYLIFRSFLSLAPPSFFFSLCLSPHPSNLTHRFFQELGTFSSIEPLFFSYLFGFCIFPSTSTFTILKIEKKTMLSVSINLHLERVTSYQGFISASWSSDLLSVLIKADASHTPDMWCQLLNQLCAAFHFRNENLDYLFITV